MRGKVSLLVIAVLALVAMPVLAGQYVDPMSKKAPAFAKVGMHMSPKSYFEGFEGAFPPTGWTQTITNASYTWMQDSYSPYEGVYAAYVQYDYTQDEVLSFQHAITAGESYLNFASMGSAYWCSYADLTVEINGTPVWSYCANATANWVWELFSVNLSAYIGQTVTIAFRYAGNDGADQYLDAVELGGPPPPPPVACDYLKPLDCIDGQLSGNTCDGHDFSGSLACSGYTEHGLEHWYTLTLAPGGSFAATVTYASKDGALWIMDACQNLLAANVLACGDATVTGGAEVVSYTNATTGDVTIYFVVDAYGTGACGDYTGSYTCSGGVIAIEASSWGNVKALYR